MKNLHEELLERTMAYVDRRGGAAIRRGGRGAGSQRRRAGVALPIYALSSFSAANYYSGTGGEVGSGVTGFGSITVFRLLDVPAATQRLRQRYGAVDGWNQSTATTGTLRGTYRNAVTFVAGTSYPIAASDAGRIHVFVTRITPTPGQLETCMDGLWMANVAQSDYVESSGAEGLGLANPSPSYEHIAHVDFRGNPSRAQIEAYLQTIRTTGDVPATMDGATITVRRSLRSQLAGTVVTHGQTAPATWSDLAGGAALTRTGAPTVRVIDTSVDGRKSYGVIGTSLASYYQTASGAGFAGSAAGFWVVAFPRIDAMPASATMRMLRKQSFTAGWKLYAITGGTAYFSILSGGTEVQAGGACITAADVGTRVPIIGVYTGTAARLYAKRAQVGSDLTGAFATTAQALEFGRDASGGAESASLFGFAAGLGVPTAGQIAAFFDAWERDPTQIIGIPGLATAQLVDCTRDVEANGGDQNGAPATLQDRAGTDHLTRVGTNLRVAQRVERVWSYETTPILRGAEAMTLADYFEAAINALPGDPNGFLVGALFKVTSQAVASTNHHLAGQRGTGNPGWDLRTSGTNTGVSFGLGSASAATTSPSSTLTAADVGKLILATGVWDGPALSARLYTKRALVASGTSLATGFVPDTAVRAQLGRRVGTPVAADGLVLYGFCYCVGVPTLAQMQAHHDHVMATERMQLPPGMPGTLIDLSTDIAGATMPDTLVDRGTGGVNFTRVGSPTVSPQYARAWAW